LARCTLGDLANSQVRGEIAIVFQPALKARLQKTEFYLQHKLSDDDHLGRILQPPSGDGTQWAGWPPWEIKVWDLSA
jgi:hypothetical protein